MNNQDLLPSSIVAIFCFVIFAVSVALIFGIVNLLVSLFQSVFIPRAYNSEFYSQVKDLMTSDFVPSIQ